jgi:hypothetical protein
LDWVTITSAGTGAGNSAVTYQVNPNTSCASRAANLTIAGQSYTIVQGGGGGSISIAQTNVFLSTSGGTFFVEVSSGFGCPWNVTGGSEWVQPVSASSGEGNATIQFFAEQNTNSDARICYINLADQVVTVNQEGLVSEPLATATFNGLFSDTAAPDHSGFFSLKKGTTSSFSGYINVAGIRRGFSGKFDVDGMTAISFVRTDSTPLILHLQITLRGYLTGTLIDGDQKSPLLADRVVFDSKTNPAPYTGKYTLAILGLLGEPLASGGIGFGAAKALPNGLINVKGTLGDGKNFSQSTFLSKDGFWPFYISPYGQASGAVSGWLNIKNGQTESVSLGNLTWVKRAIASDKFYPAGFSNSVAVIGSIYKAPTNTTGDVIGLSRGTVSLTSPEFTQGFAKEVMLLTNRIVSIPEGLDKLKFNIKKDNGLFSGTIQVPGYTATVKFKGTLLQNQKAGYGFFFGINQTGQILLEAAQ